MPCPECHSISWIFVDLYVEYREEPYSFQEGIINHIHDFNPRVSIWRCENGHEFQRSGILPCKGCMLERIEATRIATEEANRPQKMVSSGPSRSDDHFRDLPLGPGFGPGTV